jgi:hypothetical protein
MTLAPTHAFDGTASPAAGNNGNRVAQSGRFVINLCSIAAPIPIPQPRASQLTRYRFFLSHCWEEGRRRYRLHMGHFPTVADAQKWLDILRRVYPSAFVSEAPADQLDLLSNTEVLRILQQPADLSEHGAATREPVQAPRPAPPSSPAEKRDVKSAFTTRTRERQAGSALKESLEALGASEFDMHDDDELNSTGVRHLHVEVQKVRPVTRPAKGSSSRPRKL